MAHVETKDPFGFVGSHVVRRQPRKGKEEHGWLTRYNEALDCYTLFVPGGGEPRLLARGEVMKFLSAPNIELHDDDQDEFPPPVIDTSTSRYLGVKLRRPPQVSSDVDSLQDEDIRGRVTCFFPFGDRYRVEYEDGSTDEVSEAAVIDGMIALLKSPFFSSPTRPTTRNRPMRMKSSVVDLDIEDVPVRRKRQRVQAYSDKDSQKIPSRSASVIENDSQQDDDEVIIVDQMKEETGVGEETEPAPNILEIMKSASATSRETSLEIASHFVTDPMQADDDKKVELGDDIVQVVADNPEDSLKTKSNKVQLDANQVGRPTPVPNYIIEKKFHEAVKPLPRRAMAFELLRASLLNLLDRPEATTVKIAMQYDVLRNPDVRDRDAVLRFMDADGLVVLDLLLNSFATETIDDETKRSEEKRQKQIRERMARENELLHVLKIVAMLPTPSRDQVIASNIGKTINYLSKPRGPPGRHNVLPKCLNSLAKWIKSSWIKNIPPAKQSRKTLSHARQSAHRPHQKARRGGSSGRPSIHLNRPQPTPLQRPQRPIWSPSEEMHVSMGNTSIARPPHVRQALPLQQPVAAPLPTPVSTPDPFKSTSARRVTGGLKPDWMRQMENLSRSRFCIDDNTNVDTRLYRDSRARPMTNVPAHATTPTQLHLTSDQHEDAGGPDGVFGRVQRLRFDKRWNTQEFSFQDPPGILKLPPKASYPTSSYGRLQYSNQHNSVQVPPVPYPSHRPRSILRRVSRYNDEPAIDGPGSVYDSSGSYVSNSRQHEAL